MAEDSVEKISELDADNLDSNAVSSDELPSESAEQKKGKKQKPDKVSKSDKKASRAAAKEKSRLNKEWEESIVASKRVKQEENRRKVKRAMLAIIVFALIVTSLVYVMLLFVQENNVRITASSNHKEKSISLSADNATWTPFIKAAGPDKMIDLSYNTIYAREEIPTVEEVKSRLASNNVELGNMSGESYIAFGFMLRNDSEEGAYVQARMGLEYNDKGLQKAIRVMWGESFRDRPEEATVDVYAALSDDQRLEGTGINIDRTKEDGFIEYAAYPLGSDNGGYDLLEYERDINTSWEKKKEAEKNGYFATTPFESDDAVLDKRIVMAKGDIVYFYVVIWIEGSDFDCDDSVLGGYVKMDIDFIILE